MEAGPGESRRRRRSWVSWVENIHSKIEMSLPGMGYPPFILSAMEAFLPSDTRSTMRGSALARIPPHMKCLVDLLSPA